MSQPDVTCLIKRLQACDTPTVCNAIEVALGRRGFAGFTRGTVLWSGGSDVRIVGFARTARIAGNAPPQDPPEDIRARRMAYFQSMNDGPRPAVAVVEDIDGDAALGAWWGEVHAQIHKNVFGLNGALTNGVIRDLGDLPDDFPILAGSVGPSHGFVHVVDIGTPVTIFGMQVTQGDLIHADRHGAVCISADILPKLDDALDRLFAAEAVVLDPIKSGTVDFETFQGIWARFEEART